ncbi:uncharacterized protein FOMMEDRAFT_114159 [Fomitiporia mediterranea MF3/22]|uniref:uncharacterized protein n=1 Tax=Fomitiporia mediterranea (strain MF3/22) TaxID=694068 RepID=UPI0004409C34|nr:uncharacterized protein FOMMEDRAFT_114159 [Fomitiporia mediterranea MF3/22]EJC98399.1 hypothetical protein FOMMEDRAFT_114159 [Fomitiporia mediterranea MF3/22]
MPQPQPLPTLVGSIVERSSSSKPSPKPVSAPSPLGFPPVQHRSKSAFARAREAGRNNGALESDTRRNREVPIVQTSGSLLSASRESEDQDVLPPSSSLGHPFDLSSKFSPEENWKEQMRRDNDRAIDAMTEEERERHAAEILEQLGPGVTELLQKARKARGRLEAGPDVHEEEGVRDKPRAEDKHDDIEIREIKSSSPEPEVILATPTHSSPPSKLASPRRGILVSNTPPSSRSSSPGRAARKLRFADVTPRDVHVFHSEPTSPRRPIALLPPPTEQPDKNDVIKLSLDPKPEEGTPEDIRRRFFPNHPEEDPALEWIKPTESALDSEPRFDLSGALIPPSERETLPTHLGLHHHGGSAAAGYTLADLLLLARSSVPAQRATVLGVLSKLIRRLARREKEAFEFKDRNIVRAQALVVGLAALLEKGTVGMQAVDLVWACVVYWDEDDLADLEGVELRPQATKSGNSDEEKRPEDSLSSADPISSIPFSVLLPQIAALLDSRSLPLESMSQVLSIILRFARHSAEIATAITETPRLIGTILDTFLLTPIPPPEDGRVPDPLALDLLRILALSSRTNAGALVGPADALLRFITAITPTSSPFPRTLSDALLYGTLKLYAALGMYGIYSGVATTAAEHFNHLSSHVLNTSNDVSIELRVSWLRLLSVWMVCARDPHRTTPTHDLLWSQVVGWAWGNDLLEFRDNLLSGPSEPDVRIWGALCGTLASWLEGCRVNSARAGQDERATMNTMIEKTWSSGIEKALVEKSRDQLRQELPAAFSEESSLIQRKSALVRVAELSQVFTDLVRLCLACLHRHDSDSGGRSEPPTWLADVFPSLSSVTDVILSRDFWRSIWSANKSRDELSFRVQISYLRSSSGFLASFVKLSHFFSSREIWQPLAFASLRALLPGDEESATRLIEEVVEKECRDIECAEKLRFLLPFFKNMIRPDDEFYLSPLTPTPESIQRSRTQCMPANCTFSSSAKQALSGLPLKPDWSCVALDHILRSGTSPVLTNPDSVPESWNASETDLTQASLSLLLHVQRILGRSELRNFAPTVEHVVFNCMKVFMLEHNQQQNDSNEEVFRDSTVGRLMDALLEPFTLRGSQSALKIESLNLETVAKQFLGTGTPFYQFYTDFVGLYDAISFSHRTFARLLLPPTSMAYALDYRKLLWGDFGHTLRTVRTPIDEVPTLDLKEFFWPVETDAEMIGWYLRGLVKWSLEGFVRLLAVHHVACNIWSDLTETGETDGVREKRARSLLVAVFNQAKSDVVKDVVKYVQVRGTDLKLPPACYQLDGETRRARLAMVRAFGETRIAENLEKIYTEGSY